MSDTDDAIDHRLLLEEIEAEVRRRRESGDLPAGFERELDLTFARFAPVHAIGDDFDQVLERAEQSTFVDVLAPTASSVPMLRHLKRVVRKAVLWEVRFVAHQVSAFAAAITRAVRLLGQRVAVLEQSSPGSARARAEAAAGIVDLDVAHWGPVVAAALAGTPGRVLHADCGDGALVAHLTAAGLDAYGVDPLERAVAAGVEVRRDEAAAHLRALPEAGLGGVVLSGCVDRAAPATLVDLAGLAASRVAAGGAVVVVSADPRSWERARSPVERDLAGGRPLHAATWCHLLAARGLRPDEPVERPVPAGHGLRPVPGADPALAANLERLNEVLFASTEYAVVARRR